MASRLINIHGLTTLAFDDAFPWLGDWERALADTIELFSPAAQGRTTVRFEYDRELSQASKRPLFDGFHIGGGSVYDSQLCVELTPSLERNTVLLRTSAPAMEWLAPALQLGLLPSDATLVHAAAIARNGKAILFPSWGGVGKTALVASFVRERGWQFLGDDLVILGRGGTVYGFPKPMVLYPYHRALFPQVFADGRGPVAPLWMNEGLGRAAQLLKPALRLNSRLLQLARRHNPQSTQVRPSQVFGGGSIARQAELTAVVWLDRDPGLRSPVLRRDDSTVASRMMGSTLTELHVRCNQMINVALGVGILRSDAYFESWSRTLREALSRRASHSLLLPSDMPVSQVPDAVSSALHELGLC